MGFFVTSRYFFLSVCLLQMVLVVQRQVTSCGRFWLGWNIFIICLYLNVAWLDHDKNKVLKLDLNSDSWWKKEGRDVKCAMLMLFRFEYEGCLVSYVHVEIFQADFSAFLLFKNLLYGFQLLNVIIGLCLCRTFSEEDDTFNFEKPDGPDNFLLHPMYVSSSDNLHSSNRHINLTSKKYVFPNVANFNDQKYHKRPYNKQVCRHHS
ncbi:hypothetical protein NQ318_012907 [Aromia moschata]|uniref:Sodium/potassium-transporting ATPase subunit beta-1-interacting protein n=1 Tax=Aromia moschata TaxID=1265417 RepID=A0AAV8YF88_9CUCU|nr:hypothetical protein NQ318_012907 [Aromia moschata]